jgi:4-hydroxybenzoate polyprenyltransferase
MIPTNSVQNFPINVACLILIVFTLGFNAKDIKDYVGDKVDGIYTIPVLLGLERGKKIIGVLSVVCFILVPFMFRNNITKLLPISIIAGLLSFFLIIRKKYNETPLFLLYFAYAATVTLIIF